MPPYISNHSLLDLPEREATQRKRNGRIPSYWFSHSLTVRRTSSLTTYYDTHLLDCLTTWYHGNLNWQPAMLCTNTPPCQSTLHKPPRNEKRETLWENVKIYIKADEFPSQPKKKFRKLPQTQCRANNRSPGASSQHPTKPYIQALKQHLTITGFRNLPVAILTRTVIDVYRTRIVSHHIIILIWNMIPNNNRWIQNYMTTVSE